MKQKPYHALVYRSFLIGLLLLCAVLALGMLCFGPSSGLANEVQSAAPQLWKDGAVNLAFPQEAAAYLSDHFFLRRELITLHNGLSALLGSAGDGDVLIGSEGWLYYRPTVTDYTGTGLLSEQEIAGLARNLSLMQEYAEANGAGFLFMVAPNKNSLYPSHMPELGVKAETGNAKRLQQSLEALEIPYLDCFALFGAQPETLYFAHDSHWNSKGAALAADALNARMGRSSEFFSDPFAESSAHQGDLFEMLYPAAADPEPDPSYGGAFHFQRTDSGNRPDSIRIETRNEDAEGKLLAFRDSFGNLLYPFLAEGFASARFSRSAAYDLTQIGAMEADWVLVEIVERNLPRLLDSVPMMPAPQRERTISSATAMGSLEYERADGTLAGYDLLRGALPESGSGEVYLRWGSLLFETFSLRSGGFAAYLPEEACPDAAAVWTDGRWLLYELTQTTEAKG